MAHKRSGGVARNGRDSRPKYLGVKVGDGQFVKAGNILVRPVSYTHLTLPTN